MTDDLHAGVRAYRKKPVEIQAVQWDGTYHGATPIIDWVLSHGGTARYVCDENCTLAHYIAIDTLEGRMVAGEGDWIIRGVAGEFYPCKPDIFAVTYEITKQPPRAPQEVGVRMTDTLRDKIAAVLNSHVAGWYYDCRPEGEKHVGEWSQHVADAVIRELGLQPHLAKRIIDGKPDQWVRRYVSDWEIVDD